MGRFERVLPGFAEVRNRQEVRIEAASKRLALFVCLSMVWVPLYTSYLVQAARTALLPSEEEALE